MSTQTAKTHQQNQTNSVYSLYKQNVQKYFESISKNIPQYFQATTHFQTECMKAVEKSFDAKSVYNISICFSSPDSLINLTILLHIS